MSTGLPDWAIALGLAVLLVALILVIRLWVPDDALRCSRCRRRIQHWYTGHLGSDGKLEALCRRCFLEQRGVRESEEGA